MKVIIANEDAYRIVRQRRNDHLPLTIVPTPPIKEIGCGVRDLEGTCYADLATPDDPLHILVPKGGARTRSARVIQHVWQGELPEACLFATEDENVLVEAPPLMTLTLARRWPLSWLVMLVCEMCGETSAAGDKEHFVQREAVSAMCDFKDLLPLVDGRHGAKSFRKAFAAAANDCASPLEAEARALLCLPMSDGGFETGHAESNLQVVVTDPDGSQHVRYLDIAWELQDRYGRSVIKGVEVDGGQHNEHAARTSDHVRSYELRFRDIEELRCNSSILSTQTSVNKFGESVRHMLGLDPIKMTKARTNARAGLCQSIDQSPWHGLRLRK